jgi:hypothetical protein
MRKTPILPLFVLALAAGCGDASGPSRGVGLGVPFELRVGETASVDDELLTVAFHAVTSDSRCPIDVVCIVAGDATLRLGLRRLPRPEDVVEVRTPGSAAGFDGYEIEALRLLPAPRAAEPTDPAAYVASLVVRRP